MKDIKIGIKLMASFMIIAVIATCMGLYLRSNIIAMSEDISEMYEVGANPLGDFVDTASEYYKMCLVAWRLVAFENQTPEKRRELIRELNGLVSDVREGIAYQLKYSRLESDRKALNDFDGLVQTFLAGATNFANEIDRGEPPVMPQEFYDLLAGTESALRKFVDIKKGYVKDLDDKSDEAEAVAKSISAFVIIGTIIIALFFGIVITNSITKPINTLVELFRKAEKGDVTARSGLDQKDEIGIVAHSADEFFIKLREILKDLHVHSDTLAGASEELSAISRQLASASEETVGQATTVASTTEQMSVNINTMASAAEEASVNASEVASASEQMSTNMDTIASAVEEMGVSISQISSNAVEAQKVANDATHKAGEATSAMNKLGTAAKEIGHVTEVIKKIADKTNLLALNATIEAASAGEAGKGFAVVAGEIKELANQSAQSADDIARRIEGIQAGTGDAVNVITAVSDIIQRINASVEIISTNVSEQSRAVNEISSNVAQASTGAKRVASAIGEVATGSNDMSRNAGEAARGATHVASNVSSMSSAARESAQGAGQVNQSSEDLSRMAAELKGIVNQFRL